MRTTCKTGGKGVNGIRRILILTAALLSAMPALARLEKIND